MKKIAFTDEQIYLIHDILLDVKNNLVYDKEDKIYKSDYENWILNLEKYDYKMLNHLINRTKYLLV